MLPEDSPRRRVVGLLVFLVVALLSTQVATAATATGGQARVAPHDAGSAGTVADVGPERVADLSTAGPAQEQSPDICGRNVETLVSEYNDNVGRIPGFVRFIVTNKRVHLAVSGADGGDYTIATSGNGTVESYSEGTPQGARVRMNTDCTAVRDIVAADDPLGTFWDAYWGGRIDFQGNGILWFLVVEGVELLLLVSHILAGLGIPLVVAVTIAGILFLGVALVGGVLLAIALYLGYRYYRGSSGADSAAASGGGPGPGTEAEPSSESADGSTDESPENEGGGTGADEPSGENGAPDADGPEGGNGEP